MSDFFKPYEGMEPYIFVSYAHCNSAVVLPVISELHRRKYRVWYDEGIAPGSEWPENIAKHLERAGLVLVFVSKASLLSPNCENEVRVAKASGKPIITIYIDDAEIHSLLRNEKILRLENKDSDSLLSWLLADGILSPVLIGDGINGYGIITNKRKVFSIWNLIAILGVLLTLALGISVYGFSKGWFEALLPNANQAAADIAPSPTPEPTPSPKEIKINSKQLEEIIYQESGKEDLLEPIKFLSDIDKAIVLKRLDFHGELKRKDLLARTDISSLDLNGTQISDISWACYLPALVELNISNTQVSDLTGLEESQTLKRVYISTDMPPIKTAKDNKLEIVLSCRGTSKNK